MKGREVTFLICILFSSQITLACETTDEFKELKWGQTKDARKAHSECEDSISNVNYWFAFSQCIDRKNTGEVEKHLVCGRDAAHSPGKYLELKIDKKFCEEFRPGSSWFNKVVEEEALRRGIVRCK
ncbi:MAG: hypothetical protein ABW168_23240 [Sedimenticola sp.]